ncbi:MAG: DoxX family protein [Prevotellaceae bacterium]|jgi:uncharacterized membrane protein YphA (DoxX/SURF4 family)|nr:DoxX family protein [Prevotellaceae bacterium]
MGSRIKIYSLLSGVVFLLSGMAKALDAAAFSAIIAQYGVESLGVAAPVIILAEVLLGLLLAFGIRVRWAAFAGALVLLAFTLIYAYGAIFRSVEDCGCFGAIAALNTSPVFTFARNAILLYLLLAVWQKGKNAESANAGGVAVTMLAVMCMVAFMSGYTYRKAHRSSTAKEYAAQAVENTALKEFISTSKDSTYLVFAFSYSCPHCLNSIENLKQYESFGVVDKVVALAFAADSLAMQRFHSIFNPSFQVKHYPPRQLLRLTDDFPTSYYIKNDTVRLEIRGALPCGYVLQKQLHKKSRKAQKSSLRANP